MGTITIGIVVKNHNSFEMVEGRNAPRRTFVVPGLSTSSSSSQSPSSPTSSSQEAVAPTEHPASARSEVMRSHTETRRVDKQKPKIQMKMMTTKLYGDTQDASNSSHEFPAEPRAKVVPGEHRKFTHFPNDRNCDVCLRTKTCWYSRAQSG